MSRGWRECDWEEHDDRQASGWQRRRSAEPSAPSAPAEQPDRTAAMNIPPSAPSADEQEEQPPAWLDMACEECWRCVDQELVSELINAARREQTIEARWQVLRRTFEACYRRPDCKLPPSSKAPFTAWCKSTFYPGLHARFVLKRWLAIGVPAPDAAGAAPDVSLDEMD